VRCHTRHAARMAIETRYPGRNGPIAQQEYEKAVSLAQGVVR
jgi:hypothetical protein